MRVVQCFDGLQLNQEHVIDQQVHKILAHQNVFVAHLGTVLLYGRYAGGTDFIRQCILIDLFQEPSPKRIEHSECAADHAP